MVSPLTYRQAFRQGHRREYHLHCCPWRPRRIGLGSGSKDRFQIESPDIKVSKQASPFHGLATGLPWGDASTNGNTGVGTDSSTSDHDHLLRLEERVRKLLEQRGGLRGNVDGRHLGETTALQLEELEIREWCAPQGTSEQ